MSKKQRYLIVHKDDGIFLGECLGLGFCSKLDPGGQTHAVTFESIKECVDYLSTWSAVLHQWGGDQTACLWRQVLRIADEIAGHWYWLADIGSVRAKARMIGDFQDFEN